MTVVARTLLAALVLLVLTAAPAAADPARPGRYQGRVTGIEPATDAVTAKVVGGDAFLDLKVERGHTAVVLDYNQDPNDPDAVPYLRFNADGSVEENRNSLSAVTNRTRFPSSQAQPEVNAGAAPSWHKVAGGGEYTWHDHRAHWMLRTPPPGVAPGATLPIDGNVPVIVDGQPVTIHVEDRLVASNEKPAVWWGTAALLAALVIGLTLALTSGDEVVKTVAAVVALVAGVAAAVVAVAEWRSLPGVSFSAPVPTGMAIVAAVTGVVGLVLRKRVIGSVAILASAACSAGWVLTRVAVFDQPVLVTNLAPNLDRTGTAIALGLGVSAAVLTVQRGGLLLHLPDFGLDGDGDGAFDGAAGTAPPEPEGERGGADDGR